MKSNLKTKAIILIILGIIFAFPLLINANLSYFGGYNYENLEVDNEPKLKRAGYWNLTGSPIYINGNADWASKASGEDWCSGSGTWGNPYIIENVTIDGGNSSNCITIKNSNVFFRIENCTVYNSGSETWSAYAGIVLDHVNNGALINNNCSNNYYGISLVWSNNNTIYGNTANDNPQTGIMLNTYCSNNTVSGNTANNNERYGITVSWSSHNNTVSGNTANNNELGGIYVGWSSNNTISGNNANNGGISLSNSEFNIISGNTANYGGMHFSGSHNNTISGNIANNIHQFGMHFSGSNNNTISGNIANNNSNIGIRFYQSNNSIVLGNTANNNGWDGIFLIDSNFNIITENTASNNYYGIRLSIYLNLDTIWNKIYLNCFTNNTYNAYDDGSNNQWDNGSIGNYWDDYSGVDANDDGIGDSPYNINGSAGSQDNFPLMKCPISAQDGDGDGGVIPGYNLFFLLGILSVVTIILSKKKKKS